MSFWQILLLAVGLAMDSTAVAIARGSAHRATPLPASEVLRVGLAFGAAQALMPLAGWALGASLGRWLSAFGHWIAFFVLAALGAKMLREAWSENAAPDPEGRSPATDTRTGGRVLLALAIATSIDAFAIGLTLPLLAAPLALSIATIGVVTAVLSGAGVIAGRRFGTLLGRRLDAFGGLLLIGIGVKTLLEHLLSS